MEGNEDIIHGGRPLPHLKHPQPHALHPTNPSPAPSAQDPAARPTAMEILQHPFVAGAEKPPHLEAIIDHFLRSRPPVDQRRASNYGTVSSANYGTVPR